MESYKYKKSYKYENYREGDRHDDRRVRFRSTREHNPLSNSSYGGSKDYKFVNAYEYVPRSNYFIKNLSDASSLSSINNNYNNYRALSNDSYSKPAIEECTTRCFCYGDENNGLKPQINPADHGIKTYLKDSHFIKRVLPMKYHYILYKSKFMPKVPCLACHAMEYENEYYDFNESYAEEIPENLEEYAEDYSTEDIQNDDSIYMEEEPFEGGYNSYSNPDRRQTVYSNRLSGYRSSLSPYALEDSKSFSRKSSAITGSRLTSVADLAALEDSKSFSRKSSALTVPRLPSGSRIRSIASNADLAALENSGELVRSSTAGSMARMPSASRSKSSVSRAKSIASQGGVSNALENSKELAQKLKTSFASRLQSLSPSRNKSTVSNAEVGALENSKELAPVDLPDVPAIKSALKPSVRSVPPSISRRPTAVLDDNAPLYIEDDGTNCFTDKERSSSIFSLSSDVPGTTVEAKSHVAGSIIPAASKSIKTPSIASDSKKSNGSLKALSLNSANHSILSLPTDTEAQEDSKSLGDSKSKSLADKSNKSLADSNAKSLADSNAKSLADKSGVALDDSDYKAIDDFNPDTKRSLTESILGFKNALDPANTNAIEDHALSLKDVKSNINTGSTLNQTVPAKLPSFQGKPLGSIKRDASQPALSPLSSSRLGSTTTTSSSKKKVSIQPDLPTRSKKKSSRSSRSSKRRSAPDTGYASCSAITENCHYMCVGTDMGFLLIWDFIGHNSNSKFTYDYWEVAAETPTAGAPAHKGKILSIDIKTVTLVNGSEECMVLTLGEDGLVRMWILANNRLRLMTVDEFDHNKPVSVLFGKGMAMNNDIIIGYKDGFVEVWNSAALSGLSKFIPNGIPLSTKPKQGDKLTSFRTTIKKSTHTYENLTCLSISPMGSYFVLGGDNGLVSLYSLGREVNLLGQYPCRNRSGRYSNGTPVSGIDWSIDEKHLCVTTNDNRIRTFFVMRNSGLVFAEKFKGFRLTDSNEYARFAGTNNDLIICLSKDLFGFFKLAAWNRNITDVQDLPEGKPKKYPTNKHCKQFYLSDLEDEGDALRFEICQMGKWKHLEETVGDILPLSKVSGNMCLRLRTRIANMRESIMGEEVNDSTNNLLCVLTTSAYCLKSVVVSPINLM